MSSVAKDADENGNGLKLEKSCAIFFSSFNDMRQEIFQKIIIMITVVSVPCWNLNNFTRTFCV